MPEASSSPAHLVKQINTCSEEFLSRIPDWSDTPPETPVNASTRETHTQEYKEQIETLLCAAPTVKLAPEHLSDKDYNGVILYFHEQEDAYLKRKKQKQTVFSRPEQREGKYIKGLRTTLYLLLTKSKEKETLLSSSGLTKNTTKSKPKPVRIFTPVVQNVSTIVTPTYLPVKGVKKTRNRNKVPTIQIDETERATIQTLLEQLNALELTEVKSWGKITTFEAIENIKKEYTVAHTTLQHLLSQLAPYMHTLQHNEHQQRLDACTTPLNKALNIFKATQQQGNGIYNKLFLVKTELHEHCIQLLSACTEEKNA